MARERENLQASIQSQRDKISDLTQLQHQATNDSSTLAAEIKQLQQQLDQERENHEQLIQ